MSETCCKAHHFEGCTDGGPGCCPGCPINPSDDPREMGTFELVALALSERLTRIERRIGILEMTPSEAELRRRVEGDR